MAAKAEPKRRRAAKAGKSKDGDTATVKGKGSKVETKAARGKRAKAGVANGERPAMASSNLTRETIEEYWADYCTKRKDEQKAAEALKTAKSKTSAVLKSAKDNGCPIDAFKEVYSMGKQDVSEIRLHQRDVKRVLSIARPDMAQQLDMFVDVEAAPPVDYDAQGYAAYKNNEPKSNDPAKPGSEESAQWNAGWDRAMNENIMTMGPDKRPVDATVQ